MATFLETFNGSSTDRAWSILRDNIAWTLNGDGTGTLPHDSAGGAAYSHLDDDTGATDQFAEVVIAPGWANTAAGDPRAALLLRAGAGAGQTYYAASLQLTNGTLTFLSWNNGAAAPFGGAGGNPNSPVTIPTGGPLTFRFEAEGTTLRAYLNGVLVKTETSSARTTGSYAGVGVQRGTTIRFDSFRAGALADVDPDPEPGEGGLPDLIGTYQDLGAGGGNDVAVPNVQAGDRLVAIATDAYTGTAPAASGGGLTWDPIGAPLGAGDAETNQRMSAWQATANGAGTVTVTVSATSVDMSTLTVLHLRNADTVTVADRVVRRDETPTADQPLGPVTVPDGGALLVGAWAGIAFPPDPEFITWSSPAGMTALPELRVNNFNAVRVATEEAAAAGAVTRTATATPRPDSGFAGKLLVITGLAPEVIPPALVDTYTVEATNTPASLTTETFTPRQNEVIVVKAVTGDASATIGAATAPGLSFTERAAVTTAAYCAERLSTAVVGEDPDPTAVSVSFAGAAGTYSPTLIVERWAYASLASTPAVNPSNTRTGTQTPGTPESTVTTADADSVVTWFASDWRPVTTGVAAYRGTAVENYQRRNAYLNVWSAHQQATGAGAQTIGLTTPIGQKWSMVGVELLPGPAPIEGPAGPDTAAERYAWGTPLPASDEFDYTGVPDPAKWALYDDPNGHDGNGTRDPERINVIAGTGPDDPASFLRIDGLASGSTGGMAHLHDRRYGRWEVRARFDAVTPGSAGGAYHALLIIWPNDNLPKPDWPQYGEYDWLEIVDVEQDYLEAYLHYPHPNMPVEQEIVRPNPPRTFDFSQWHNYGFEWVEGRLRGFIDGDEWFDLDGSMLSTSGDRLDGMPSGHLTVQLDNFTGDGGLQPAFYDVAWARVYPAGGSAEVGYATASSALTPQADAASDKRGQVQGETADQLAGQAVEAKTGQGTATAALELDGVATAVKRAAATAGASLPLGGRAQVARTIAAGATSALELGGEAGTTAVRGQAGRSPLGLSAIAVSSAKTAEDTASAALELAGRAETTRTASTAVGSALELDSHAVTTTVAQVAGSSALPLAGRAVVDRIGRTAAAAELTLSGRPVGSKVTGTEGEAPLPLGADAMSSQQQIARARSALLLGTEAQTDRASAVEAVSVLGLGGRVQATRTAAVTAEAALGLAQTAVTARISRAEGEAALILGSRAEVTRAIIVTARSALPLEAVADAAKLAVVAADPAVPLDAQVVSRRSSAVAVRARLPLSGVTALERIAAVGTVSPLLLGTDVLSGSGTQVAARSPLRLAARVASAKVARSDAVAPVVLLTRVVSDRISLTEGEPALLLAGRTELDGRRAVVVRAPLLLAGSALAELPALTFPPVLGRPVLEQLVHLGRPELDALVVVGPPRTS